MAEARTEKFDRPRDARRVSQDAARSHGDAQLTEDEAISLTAIAVDFGITQVVDGNWGVHAVVVKKAIFPPAA